MQRLITIRLSSPLQISKSLTNTVGSNFRTPGSESIESFLILSRLLFSKQNDFILITLATSGQCNLLNTVSQLSGIRAAELPRTQRENAANSRSLAFQIDIYVSLRHNHRFPRQFLCNPATCIPPMIFGMKVRQICFSVYPIISCVSGYIYIH